MLRDLQLFRRLLLAAGSVVVAALIAIAAILASNLGAAAQNNSGENAVKSLCASDNKAFQVMSPHLVKATFIAAPAISAGSLQTEKHMIYSRILGTWAYRQLRRSSGGRCSLVGATVPTLDFYFVDPSSSGCAFRACVQSMTEMLRSAVIDRETFSDAIASVATALRFQENADLKDGGITGDQAAREAFLYIYPQDSTARVFAALSSQKFLKTPYEEFLVWFKIQQAALQRALEDGHTDNDHASTYLTPADRVGSAPQNVTVRCMGVAADLKLRELTVPHQGWGNRSIIMIRHGAGRGFGESGIENATLRAFCSVKQSGDGLNAVDPGPWRDMARRVVCKPLLADQDDEWLVLSSRQTPAVSSADMKQLAEEIRRTLSQAACINPDSQMYVVNFLTRDDPPGSIQ